MNMQPKHDLETGDLRRSAEIVAMPNGINVGDLPNSDTATDDLRGHESSPIANPETDSTRLLVGAAAVAALIGALGIASYATGMWKTPPRAFAPRIAAAADIPVVAPQAVVPPSTPIRVVPPNEVVPAPAPPHVTKRSTAPAARALPAPPTSPEPLVNTTPTPVLASPPAPVLASPPAPVPSSPPANEPALPTLSLPDLPSATPPQ